MALRVLEGKPLAVGGAMLRVPFDIERKSNSGAISCAGLRFHPLRPLTLRQGSTSLIGQPFHE